MLLEALWSTSQLQHSHTTQPNLSIIMAADRFSINKSWDQVQNKFVGTGHSDMSKFEWASNQHRDTIASHIGKRQSRFLVVNRLFPIKYAFQRAL